MSSFTVIFITDIHSLVVIVGGNVLVSIISTSREVFQDMCSIVHPVFRRLPSKAHTTLK
jgi:flagellar motor component MotA